LGFFLIFCDSWMTDEVWAGGDRIFASLEARMRKGGKEGRIYHLLSPYFEDETTIETR